MEPPAQAPPRQPTAVAVSLLYVFAGQKRKSDVGEQLADLQRQGAINLEILELDLLRSEAHDVLQEEFWEATMKKLDAGFYKVLIITPPCNTHSRARNSGAPGPPPVRSKRYPKGFPWLSGRLLRETVQANKFVELTFSSCRRAHKANAAFLIEHPDDLGAAADGDMPASIFALQEMFDLVADTGAETASFFQCPFGANSAKPTRIVTTLPIRKVTLKLPKKLYFGWGVFCKRGFYTGPMPRNCGHKHRRLLGKPSAGEPFRTAAAAAYPAAMCLWLALLVVHFCSYPKEGDTTTAALKVIPGTSDRNQQATLDKPEADITTKSQEEEAGIITQEEIDDEETSDEEEPGIRRPNYRDHLPGVGPPVPVRWGGKIRELHDGGGLCSPGRWIPPNRLTANWPCTKPLKKVFKQLLRNHVGDVDRLVMKLCCGKILESPFSDSLISEGRLLLCSELAKTSRFTVDQLLSVQRDQPYLLHAIGELLREQGDPDWRIYFASSSPSGNFTDGVAVGVGVRLPRTPALYERKQKWRKLDESLLDWDMGNYVSASGEEMSAVLTKQFEEEESLGMMFQVSLAQAKALYPEPGTLRIAAQAAIQKADDSFRILHDGTHGVQVNNETKVRDRMRMPSAGDARSIMQFCARDRPGPHLHLLADVRKAHRRFLHRKADWGLLACRSSADLEKVWLNKVGTFGFVAASYWFGRLASGVHRAALRFFCEGLDSDWIWALLFADDLDIQAHGPNMRCNLLLLLFLWTLLGTPFAWGKCRGGLEVEWIGYLLDYGRFQIGISESRCRWLITWCETILLNGVVLIRALAEGLGRLGYCAGVLEWCRPFLAPIYSWCAAAPGSAILPVPVMIKLTLSFILQQLKDGRRTVACQFPTEDLGELFRTDAKGAEDRVVIGGWECINGTPPARARWFSATLLPDDHPWLFERGHSSRTIAASEMLGTLVAIFLFCPVPSASAPTRGLMKCGGATDNRGNMFVINKMLTTKLPLAAVLMQMAVMLSERNLWLEVGWLPREQNVEADSLTNDDFTSFDPSLRMEVDWAAIPTGVMTQLLEQGLLFEAELNLQRQDKRKQGPTATRSSAKKKREQRTSWEG